MFYSQFILAKKGPLGTIWIAAHLERKLRKNQVADTDIGVSVDSILFPDVPIALRLSSHLLVGVVRIYSRKVNYLFDDCSEALLKIKQAFRSTAVDLPPEQSKAPYHSITLPETFDLDDFELPDNEIFQGNYVDHHVSSREQITLQDTMDGVAYSTTRFGLDERFGDGDTSGLDLDEELFLDKVGASGHAGVSSDCQASVQPMTALKQGDQHEAMTANSEPMIDGVDEVIHLMDDAQAPRTPGLVEEPNLSNVQETSACDDHFESEDHHITVSAVKENLENISGGTDIHHENKHVDDWSLPNDKNSHPVVHEHSENGYHPDDLNIKQLKPQEISSATELTVERFSPDNHASASGPSSLLDKHVTQVSPVSESRDKIAEVSDFPCRSEHIHEGVVDNNKANICSVHESLEDYGSNLRKNADDISGSAWICQQAGEGVLENNHTSPVIEVSDNLDSAGMLEKSRSPSSAIDLGMDYQGRPCQEKAEGQTCQEEKESRILSSDINGKISAAQVHVLRPCNANLDQLDSSNPEGDQSVDPNLSNENATLGSLEGFGREEIQHASETFAFSQGEVCHVIDGTEKLTTEGNVRDGASDEGFHSAIGKSNDKVDNGILGGSPVEHVNSSTGPDLPAPEKMLSVTEGPDNLPRNLLMESTPRDLVRNDDGDAGSNVISGKKRSYTESTLTEQSLNSVESSRIVRSKRTVESIPDDDDLLSSILVGRRSSVLKVKPTPPASEITSVKRTHSASRTSAIKRKVLMDDTMVLHGDTIRQQLMNTEAIRRARKKAPCTRPEISMIQKQFLEDEIFIEPVYTGVSSELASLHNQTCDLSGIRISLDDVNCAALGTATDINNQNDDDNIRNLNTENAVNSSLQNIAKESETEGTNKLLTVTDNCERETVGAPVDVNKLDEDNSVSLDVNITQLQMKTITGVEPNSLLLEPPKDIPESEAVLRSSSTADGVNIVFPGEDESSLHTDQVSGNQDDTLADVAQVAPADDNSAGVVQTTDNIKTYEQDASLHIDAPDVSHDQKTDEVSLRMDVTGGEVVEGHDIVGKDCDHTAIVEAEPRTGDEVLLEAAEGDVTAETAADANDRKLEYDSHDLVDKGIEQSIMDSSFPGEVDMRVEDVLLDVGEHPSLEVVNPLNMTDAEISAIYDHDDVNYSTARNDTEFLNVDDDEVVEPTDDYIPNEETRLTDNSGWSSRTRAVANYLQTLFVKQAGNGRPALSMDSLLVGKTRKEASRMFFEALVLKTKDYVHVEQGNPFDKITIKPRTKLMKTDF